MPMMKDWERYEMPHCVYRIYRADGQALYIGCSLRPFARLSNHEAEQPWYSEAATIELTWHPTWHHGRSVEMGAIIAERPLHNRLVHDVATVGGSTVWVRGQSRPRGNGKDCPKCGKEKETRTDAYCKKCASDYQRERRRRAAESLARTLSKTK